MSIDITGIDKVALLAVLWSGQRPAGFFNEQTWAMPGFNKEKATEAVKTYIDYFCGRAIKTNLSQNEVDPWLYDRDAGQGAFAEAVKSLK